MQCRQPFVLSLLLRLSPPSKPHKNSTVVASIRRVGFEPTQADAYQNLSLTPWTTRASAQRATKSGSFTGRVKMDCGRVIASGGSSNLQVNSGSCKSLVRNLATALPPASLRSARSAQPAGTEKPSRSPIHRFRLGVVDSRSANSWGWRRFRGNIQGGAAVPASCLCLPDCAKLLLFHAWLK